MFNETHLNLFNETHLYIFAIHASIPLFGHISSVHALKRTYTRLRRRCESDEKTYNINDIRRLVKTTHPRNIREGGGGRIPSQPAALNFEATTNESEGCR